jgi:hypothetical protein
VLLASCIGGAVVRGTILGVNGEPFYMLYRMLNCIQCPVIEALMPELECERVPVQLEDNSVVWSEGIGVCWFEPMLEGSRARGTRAAQCHLVLTPNLYLNRRDIAPCLSILILKTH